MLRSLQHRRSGGRAVAAAAVLALLATAAAAEPRRYEFDVLLDARPIGQHRFEIAAAPGGRERVTSEASFDVRFLGINALRYRHRASEHWEAGCLVGIESETRENGRALAVRGARDGAGFRVAAPVIRRGDGCVASYAYWDRGRLLAQRTLLNPQTGEFDAVRIEPAGRETLQVRGAAVPAHRYRLHGPKFVIDLWYAESGEWLQLESTTGSKRRLRYRLRA
jgi:hypothetical protein